MRSIKSSFLGLVAGGALVAGLLVAAPARAQVAPVDEQGMETYAAPAEAVADGAAVSVPGATFVGSHPIPYDHGGGYCQAAGPHQHDYGPFDQNLFRPTSEGYAFVGDPADFGASASYVYAGNHPLAAGLGGGYCYMGWAHRHTFAPVGVGFTLAGGVYTYGGVYGADYYGPQLAWTNYYNNYYRANYWGGRYWTVRPRPIYGWGGPAWGARAGYYPGYRAPVYGGYRAPVYGGYRPAAPVYGGYRPAAPVYGGYRPAAPVYGGYRPAAPVYGGYRPAAPGFGGYRPAAPAYGGYHAAPHFQHAAPMHMGRGGHR